MENFSLTYTHEVEDYFNPEVFHDYSFQSGHFDGKDFSKYLDYDEYLESFINFRKIIKRDIQSIINTRIKGLNNNEGLMNELNTVVETVDNGIDFDFMNGENFAFRTDAFLCFNNYENYVDELEWESLGSDAKSYETIVIIDSHLKNFYFIRTSKKICSLTTSTTINAYQVMGKNVKRRKVNFKNGLTLIDHSEEEILKILSLVS